MKKIMNALFCAILAFALPLMSFAGSDDAPKGKRGGLLIGDGEKIRFEMIDDGASIRFFPVGPQGEMLSTMPTHAEINIVYIDTQVKHHERNVELHEGAFTVNPPRDMKIFLYGISCEYNGSNVYAKYRDFSEPVR
ncbi:MAG: hypothetical protein ACK5CT_01905 [Bacteroidota bacterium]|jgi:hypothetical protein